jgi:hypothetical protein
MGCAGYAHSAMASVTSMLGTNVKLALIAVCVALFSIIGYRIYNGGYKNPIGKFKDKDVVQVFNGSENINIQWENIKRKYGELNWQRVSYKDSVYYKIETLRLVLAPNVQVKHDDCCIQEYDYDSKHLLYSLSYHGRYWQAIVDR